MLMAASIEFKKKKKAVLQLSRETRSAIYRCCCWFDAFPYLSTSPSVLEQSCTPICCWCVRTEINLSHRERVGVGVGGGGGSA